MTWSPWAISTVSAAARLGVGAAVSVGADEAVVSGVGVGSAEVDGVSVGAAEDGSSLPVTVAVAVAVGDAVAGGGLTDGLAVGGWLDPAPGAWVGTRIATTDEPPASEPTTTSGWPTAPKTVSGLAIGPIAWVFSWGRFSTQSVAVLGQTSLIRVRTIWAWPSWSMLRYATSFGGIASGVGAAAPGVAVPRAIAGGWGVPGVVVTPPKGHWEEVSAPTAIATTNAPARRAKGRRVARREPPRALDP